MPLPASLTAQDIATMLNFGYPGITAVLNKQNDASLLRAIRDAPRSTYEIDVANFIDVLLVAMSDNPRDTSPESLARLRANASQVLYAEIVTDALYSKSDYMIRADQLRLMLGGDRNSYLRFVNKHVSGGDAVTRFSIFGGFRKPTARYLLSEIELAME